MDDTSFERWRDLSQSVSGPCDGGSPLWWMHEFAKAADEFPAMFCALREARDWAEWFAAERDWHAAGHHNYARLLREQVTYCREDCPNDNSTELRQVQDLVRWLTAERDWLRQRSLEQDVIE